jgi:hypothetical protein
VTTRKVNTETSRKSTKSVKPVKAPRDWGSIVVKVIMLLGLLIIGASLGVISYRHGFHVALDHGQEWLTAILLPAGVDGGLLVSAAAMIAPRTRAATRGMARITFVVCLITTVAMNALAAGTDADLISMVISGIPGVLFVLVIETALRLIRDMTRKTTERDTLNMVGKLMLSIKASRARAQRRQRDAAKRARETPAKVKAPSEAKAATAWIKAQTDAQASAA